MPPPRPRAIALLLALLALAEHGAVEDRSGRHGIARSPHQWHGRRAAQHDERRLGVPPSSTQSSPRAVVGRCPELSRAHLATRAVSNTVLFTALDAQAAAVFLGSWMAALEAAGVTYWFAAALDAGTSGALAGGAAGPGPSRCFDAPPAAPAGGAGALRGHWEEGYGADGAQHSMSRAVPRCAVLRRAVVRCARRPFLRRTCSVSTRIPASCGIHTAAGVCILPCMAPAASSTGQHITSFDTTAASCCVGAGSDVHRPALHLFLTL